MVIVWHVLKYWSHVLCRLFYHKVENLPQFCEGTLLLGGTEDQNSSSGSSNHPEDEEQALQAGVGSMHLTPPVDEGKNAVLIHVFCVFLWVCQFHLLCSRSLATIAAMLNFALHGISTIPGN